MFQTEWLRLPSDCPNVPSQKDSALSMQKSMKKELIMMLVGPSVWSILIVVIISLLYI